MDPGAEPKLARRVGQVGRVDRVLEERLDARDEDARPAAPPGGERRDAGRGLVGDQLAALVGERGPRLEHRDGLGIAEPRAELLGHPVADLGVAGDPDEPLAIGRQREGRREIALGAVRDGDEADMPAGPSRVVRRRPRRSRRAANVPVAASSGGSTDRSGIRWPPPFRPGAAAGRGDGRRAAGRAAAGSPALARVLHLGVDRGDVEVDAPRPRRGAAWRAAKSVATRSAIRRSRPRRPRIGGLGHAQASGLAGRIRRQPVRVRRMPSASGGPSTSPGGGEPGRVGRPELEHVEAVGGLVRALARPLLDRVRGGVEELVETLLLVGREARQDVVDGRPVRLADPDPQPAELLGAELVDDRAQAVVAARPAALAEAQLAERQREVVGDDEQVDQRRVLAGEDLADREARIVHVGQRLDERQVEAAVAAHRRRWTRRAGGPCPSSRPARRSGP